LLRRPYVLSSVWLHGDTGGVVSNVRGDAVDKEWLPYQEVLDYKAFSVSVNRKELSGLGAKLAAITDAEYEGMREEIRRVRRWFTLEGMADYIMKRIALT
jgi:hypothetical protein